MRLKMSSNPTSQQQESSNYEADERKTGRNEYTTVLHPVNSDNRPNKILLVVNLVFVMIYSCV